MQENSGQLPAGSVALGYPVPVQFPNGAPQQSQPPVPFPSSNPPSFDPNMERNWTSGPCDCAKDEESCWWGTWCCCILFGRNVQTFGVGSSSYNVYVISAWIFICVLALLFAHPLFFWVTFLGSIAYTVQRARMRTAIRQKLGVYGNFFIDCVYHCFLKQCSVCQEAREAKTLKLKEVDYISGQDMSELAMRDDDVPPNNFQELYRSLSLTSRLIVKLSALFVLFITIVLAIRRPSYLLILFLVFLQPAAILYFVYWRQRRQFVQMDYVVKLFMVGFFMSTTQSIVFEEILQTIITVVMFVVFLIFNSNGTTVDKDNGAANPMNQLLFNPNSSSHTTSTFLQQNMLMSDAGNFWQSMQLLRQCQQRPLLQSLLISGQDMYELVSSFFVPASSSPSTIWDASTVGMMPLTLLPAISQYWSSDEFAPTASVMMGQSMHMLASNGTSPATNDDMISTLDQGLLRRNFLLLTIYLFLLAFVVAAGVEETMKHFVVRCCRFPQSLKEPQTMMVYLLTAALGFATAENIEYVLGAKSSPIAGVSLFVGELFILTIRILMPIHLICAVLQAAEMSKRETGIDPNMPLFKVLLPAVVLHGSFDFFLFFVSALQYVFNIRSLAFDIFTMIFPFVMTIGGIVWAVKVFGAVERQYRSEWRPLQAHAPETSQPRDDEMIEIQMNVLHDGNSRFNYPSAESASV